MLNKKSGYIVLIATSFVLFSPLIPAAESNDGGNHHKGHEMPMHKGGHQGHEMKMQMGGHQGHEMPMQKEMIAGVGVVNTIDLQAKKVNITHQPIKVIGWPKMKMNFALHNKDVVHKVQQGDFVQFQMKKEGNNYVIHEIKVLKR